MRGVLKDLPWAKSLEAAVILVLGVYAFFCGVAGAIIYRENPLIGNGVCMAALIYLNALGSGGKWGLVIPTGTLVLLTIAGACFVTGWADVAGLALAASPCILALVMHTKFRKQALILPLALLCSLIALVSQIIYVCTTGGWFPMVFDTLALLLMCAETGLRSYTSLVKGRYYYTDFLKKRTPQS